MSQMQDDTIEHGYARLPATPVFDMQMKDERKGVKPEARMAPVNVQGIGEQQVASLTRVFQKDGYSVTVKKR